MIARNKGIVGLALLSAALAGCGLPTSVPRGEFIETNAEVTIRPERAKSAPYCLVAVTPDVLTVAQHAQHRLAGRFNDHRGPTSLKIGVGDIVSVTIYELGVGGLFFPLEGGLRQGNYITLPNQEVDNLGNISVPYAGSIRARGRTMVEIQNAIVSALKSRALDPQAVVSLIEQRAALISVLGEVGTPTRFRASAGGERVLDAISRAGGPRAAGHETWVLLERGSKIAVTPFEALIREPANNIYVRPQDTIYLFKEAQTFLAFGATERQGQFAFDQWRLSLAEAIARSGGLSDSRAEPSWVFLYRLERRETVEKIDPKCLVSDAALIPVIYEIDLRDPASYFLASRFPMRDKDVLMVSNSRTVEATKFMTYIRSVSQTISDPMQTAITAYGLKAAINGTSSGTTIITGNTVTP